MPLASPAPAVPSTLLTSQIAALEHERDSYRSLAQKQEAELQRLQQYHSDQIVSLLTSEAQRHPFRYPIPPPPIDPARVKRMEAALADFAEFAKLSTQIFSESVFASAVRIPPLQIGAAPRLELPAPLAEGQTFVVEPAAGNTTPLALIQKSPTSWKPEKPLVMGRTYRWRIVGKEPEKEPLPFGQFRIAASDEGELKKRFGEKPLTLGTIYFLAGQPEKARAQWSSLPSDSPARSVVQTWPQMH